MSSYVYSGNNLILMKPVHAESLFSKGVKKGFRVLVNRNLNWAIAKPRSLKNNERIETMNKIKKNSIREGLDENRIKETANKMKNTFTRQNPIFKTRESSLFLKKTREPSEFLSHQKEKGFRSFDFGAKSPKNQKSPFVLDKGEEEAQNGSKNLKSSFQDESKPDPSVSSFDNFQILAMMKERRVKIFGKPKESMAIKKKFREEKEKALSRNSLTLKTITKKQQLKPSQSHSQDHKNKESPFWTLQEDTEELRIQREPLKTFEIPENFKSVSLFFLKKGLGTNLKSPSPKREGSETLRSPLFPFLLEKIKKSSSIAFEEVVRSQDEGENHHGKELFVKNRKRKKNFLNKNNSVDLHRKKKPKKNPSELKKIQGGNQEKQGKKPKNSRETS